MENKKSGVLIGVIIGLLIGIIIGLCLFIVMDKKDNDKKDNDTKQTTENTNNTDNNVTPTPSSQSFDLADFDVSKVINKDDRIAYKAESVKEASYSFDTVHPEIMVSTNKDVKVRVNWNDLCFLGKESKDYPYAINLDKEVKTVYVGGWGQTVGNSYIFYLMSDGTLEYTSLACETVAEEAISSDSYELKSLGTVPGVSDIVMLAQIAAGPADSEAGGYSTTLAIKADGTFYDLSLILD